ILNRNEASLSDNPLRHNDSFRLSLSAFNRTFHLHLIPNDHLIPEDAVATVYDENNVKKVINLHGQVRAYKGVVVESEFTDKTDMNVGTASVVVLHDGFNEHSNSHLQNHYPDHRQPVVIGTLTTNSEVYHIQPTHSYRLSKRSVDPSLLSISARNPEHQSSTMIIYRDSDFKRSAILQKRNEPSAEATCGADRLVYNKNYTQQHPPLGIKELSAFEKNLKEYQSSLQDAHTSRRLVKRQAGRRQLSSSIGCPVDTRMLYIGMAADCSYSARFKNNETDIFTQLVNNINSVSELYQRTFNLGIGITKIEIRTSCGKDDWNRLCDNAYPIGKRLSDFSNWRSSQPPTEALWHLMTDCPTRSPNGGGDTLGIAWSGTVCETQARQQSKNGGVEVVSGTGVSSAGRTEWKIVAHEIAHNLGAIHDCTSTDVCTGSGEGSCCPCNGQCDCGKQFIMNPTDNTASSDFSPCSISDVCTTIGAKLNQCFQRPGSRQTLQGQVCGNGILEPGEECDCGQNCANDRCCTSECKLKPPAVCSDRNHACCSQCQFKPRGTVCRPALSTCDIEEACPGDNGLCPTDVTLPNGQKCRVNGTDAYCASGQCTSKDLQCQVNSKGRFKQTCRGGARDDCSLVCQDPTNEIRCAVLDQLLLDGTECGFGGECAGGQCQNSSIFNVPKRWISENLPWAIAIGVILGLGVLWCIWISCIRSCFTRRKR
ncbi:Metallo-peptidase family M12-domain-containing protein, partial [Paraphysoderma sedebokerense]